MGPMNRVLDRGQDWMNLFTAARGNKLSMTESDSAKLLCTLLSLSINFIVIYIYIYIHSDKSIIKQTNQ